MNLSISCVTYNPNEKVLDKVLTCLSEAINNARNVVLVNLIIVDNGPGAEAREILDRIILKHTPIFKQQHSVRVVSGQGNIGFGAGHNLALRDLKSDYHLVLNPDIYMDEMAIDLGGAYLDGNPGVAVVSPSAFEESGEIQYIAKRYPSLVVLFMRAFVPSFVSALFRSELDFYEVRDLVPCKSPLDIEIASGCFMLCRTSVLQKSGGFDESFFLYFEDFDLSLRIRENHRIVQLPAMKVVHLGGCAAQKGWRHIRYFLTSAWRFFNKHGWKFY